MVLNSTQNIQVRKQLLAHKHKKYKVDIVLSRGSILKDFEVFENVFRPELNTSIFLAKYLYKNKSVYRNKTILDLGSGTGIQGIITGLYGAKKVIFSDISTYAIDNIKENVTKFNLNDKSVVINSNLFNKIKLKVDLIIFNHPFFATKPLKGNIVSKAMLDSGNLIKHFLREARDHLTKSGLIIMPFFDLAGKTNDPAFQALKYGYKVRQIATQNIKSGLQMGQVFIYQLE